MQENALPLKEELMAYLYDPERLQRIAATLGLDMRTYVALL